MKASRPITGSFLCWMTVLIGVALLSGCAEPGPDELLSRARTAVDEGSYRTAMIDLRNAVANDPTNAQARFDLGVVALVLGDPATAEKEVRRARELGYDEPLAALPMAEALIALRRPAQALAELTDLAGSNATAAGLEGLAHERLGDSDEALRAYQRSLAANAEEERALLGLARLLAADGDRVAAEETLDRARAAHPDSSLVALDYGRFLFLTQRPAEAEAAYRAALEKRSQTQLPSMRWDLLLSLTEAQLSQGKLEDVEETTARLQELQPDSVLIKYVEARVAFARDDIPLANELAARVLVEAPEFNPALMLQAKIFLADSAFIQARQLLLRLTVRDPNNAEARRLLDAAQEGIAEGDDKTRKAGRTQSQADFLALVGSAKAESGDIPGAVLFWEQSVSKNPDNQDLKLELLSAYVRAGMTEQARAMITQTRWVAEFARARVAMIEIMLALQESDLEQARERAAAAAVTFPSNASITTLQGLVEVRDAPDVAKGFFEKALTQDPANSAAVINLSSLADRAGTSPDGVAILRAFLESNPDDGSVQEALASKLLRRGNRDEAVASLRAARDANPNAVTARLELTRLLVQSGDATGAEVVAREAVALRPQLPAAHNALGVALLAQGKSDAGAESLRAALRLKPSFVEALRNLMRANVSTANFAQAEITAQRLLALLPDDAHALETTARIALGQNRLDEAEARIAKYEAAAPERSRTPALVMRGDIARARGEGEQALDYFEQVLALAPSPNVVERVFKARQELGREDAEAVLTAWLAERPQDNGIRLLLAQSAHVKGEMTRAAAEYERILQTSPRSLVTLNNLALVYGAADDERAVEVARRAFDLAPNYPIVQDTYGWALVRFGQLENGVSILQDAWEGAPDNGDVAYHYAAALVQSGQGVQAKEILVKALAAEREFESRAAAQALLATL